MISCYILAGSSSIHAITGYINQLFLPLTGFSSDFSEGFQSVLSFRPDLLFMDMDFALNHTEEVALLKTKSALVLLSENPGHAFHAFEYQAFDFMISPLKYGRFLQCIEKYSAMVDRLPAAKDERFVQNSFFVKTDAKGLREMKVKYADVIYIEAMQNYVTLHLENEKHFLIFNTMKEMEENLPRSIFSRIHKSFLINDNKVTYFEGNAVILNDNIKLKIVIGNTYRKVFIEKKNKIMIKGNRQKRGDAGHGNLGLSLSASFAGVFGLCCELIPLVF